MQSRRRFLLGLGAGSLLTLAAPLRAQTKLLVPSSAYSNRLAIKNLNTGESFFQDIGSKDSFDGNALAKLDYILRDYRRGEKTSMDPALYVQMLEIQHQLGDEVEFTVISAYRSPATNANMRKKNAGVAKKSYHMKGQAMDISVAGVSTKALRSATLQVSQGGVGYYPRSGFIHIDTGPKRSWNG
ncbi:YcbK family protein [Alginatibacterium sediminis]|uniref:YcbK family protein n=1 Tax=Alginatibacterium sediminis TaxID=2164068 RepID=UPI0013149000|nr:YcbK family protein [Alginatibacterium sediminis]